MSFSILTGYVLLGLSLGAPMGPINSARLDKGIKNGVLHSCAIGFGGMAADALFMLLIYFGLARFLHFPIVQIFLTLFGAFVLIYSGVESIIRSNTIIRSYKRGNEKWQKSLLTGFFIALTNPISILFWLGIYGSILARVAYGTQSGTLIVYTVFIFLGLMIWDLFMAVLIGGFRRFLTATFLRPISILSGASLVCFGIYFAIRGFLLF